MNSPQGTRICLTCMTLHLLIPFTSWLLLCCLWCELHTYSACPSKSWCSSELLLPLSFKSAHFPWAYLSILSFNINTNAVAALKRSLWLKIICWALTRFPKCLSAWMFFCNHLKFKMLNILYLLHVIHPKLSFVPISPMLSHDQHYHLSTRPSQNSAVNPRSCSLPCLLFS